MRSMKSDAPQDIDEYISNCSPEAQQILQKIRRTIKKNAPGSSEAIRYQMPTFQLNGNMVHFAAYKKHIGFYPAPSAIIHFQKQLAGYVTSKGAVQFPLDQPIPYDLIAEIVRFRVDEQNSLKPKKRRT